MRLIQKVLLPACILSALALFSAPSASAQQLPNNSFDDNWSNCSPWTSNGTTTVGKTPTPWTISHVAGYKLFSLWMGKTEVGSQDTGRDGTGHSVKLLNAPNSTVSDQTVPGYISLGTSWSTANTSAQNKDGGTFGGLDFTYRPDAVTFYYKRTHGSTESTEPAAVIVYSWKGQWTQASVPGNIASSPKTVTMTDRERNILDIPTAKGGTVSKTDDAELISSLIYEITGDAEDWTQQTLEIPYHSDATPSKFNIIFSSGNYWDDSNIGQNNALWIDDVKLLYYSRLSQLSIGGVDLPDFDADTYTYNVEGGMPQGEISYTLLGEGHSATATVTRDEEAARIIVTVTNPNGEDADDLSEHTYTVQYSVPVESIAFKADAPDSFIISRPGTAIAGFLTLTSDNLLFNPTNATDKSVTWNVENADGIVTWSVENSQLTLNAVAPGVVTVTATTSNGLVASRTITVKPKEVTAVSLAKIDMFTGMTRTLGSADVTIEPEDAYDRTPVFSLDCSDGSVTLSDNILVAVQPGSAQLTAVVGAQSATAEVSVATMPVMPSALSISQENVRLYLGEGGVTLTAVITPADANTMISTEWSSDNEDIVTVSDGKLVPVAKGSANVTCTLTYAVYDADHIRTGEQTLTATCAVTVLQPVTGIAFDTDAVTLKRGEVRPMAVTVTPEDADMAVVSYTIDNTDVATVDADGNVTAVAKGQATLSAVCGQFTATCDLTVVVGVESLTISAENTDLMVGESTQLTYTVNPEDADYTEVTWTSSDESVLTIDAQGLASAVGDGTVTVTATCNDVVSNELVIVCTQYPSVTYTYTGWTTLTADGNNTVTTNTVTIVTTADDAAILTIEDFRYGGMRLGDVSMKVNFDSQAALNDDYAGLNGNETVGLMNGSIMADITVSGSTHLDRGDAMCVLEADITVPDWDGTSCHVLFTTYPTMKDNVIEGTLTYTWNGYDFNDIPMTLSVTPDRKDPEIVTLTIHNLAIDDINYGTLSLPEATVTALGNNEYLYEFTGSNMSIGDAGVGTVSLRGTINNVNRAKFNLSISGERYADLNGVFSAGSDEVDPLALRVYEGTLDIEMAGSAIAENQPAQVMIKPNGDGTCTFSLPDFKLDLGGVMELGDIVVENVEATPGNDGSESYSGSVKEMSLMQGAIIADVDLTGTVDAQGVARMDIVVLWSGVTINVQFNGNGPAPIIGGGTTGVVDTVADSNTPVEYYTIQGIRVAADRLLPGAYIERRGNTIRKIWIK